LTFCTFIGDRLRFPEPNSHLERLLDPWKSRFHESTRGKLVGILRQSSATVEDLARALGITDNAVRSQLASLERDGVVRQQGLRRGAGKPSYLYALAPDFEPALSRAYLPLLVQLLREINDRNSDEEVTELFRDVGRRWGAELGGSRGDLKSRVAAASALLNQLGGITEVEAGESGSTIRGLSCPLEVAVKENPRACVAIESLLTELIGAPVRECCDRSGERTRCCFSVGTGPA